MGYTMTFYDRAPQPRAFTLTIAGGGTSIQGGESPFETVEETDADMFKPVRCQSGTFRFITENGDSSARSKWLGMIPADSLDKTVKLQIGSNVVWQGYIQPQIFQNAYPGLETNVHEIPVQCPLSVLDSLDIDPNPNSGTPIINSHPTITFGELLQTYIFGRLTGTTFQYFYVQGSVSVTTARLAVKVMWQNFLDTDSNGHITCKYTCKQVLEEFCKFFGYQCRMSGKDVFFTQPTGNSAGFSRFSALTGTPTAVNRGTFSLADAMFIDTEDFEEVHPGVGKVTVRSDINELDNLIEIPYNELYDQYNVGIPSSPIIVRPVDWYEREVYNLIRQPNASSSTLNYQNDTVSMSCYMATVPGIETNAGNNKVFCRFFVYDDSDVGSYVDQEIPESKERFNWVKCVELFHSYENTSSPSNMFTIASKQQFVICDGMLYINFKCDEVSAWITQLGTFLYKNPSTGEYNIQKPYCYATAKLRVGNKYWNGSAWTTSSSATFELPFTSSGAKGNRSDYGGIYAPQYDGYGIPVTGTMRGDMEFKIIDVPPFITAMQAPVNGFLPLLDFEIGFVRGVIEDTQHRSNEYTVSGGAFRDEIDVDLIWASDVPYGPAGYQRRMPAGLGYILNSSDQPKQFVASMSGTDVVAEEMVAGLIAAYGQRTHRLVQMNLRTSSFGFINPTQLSYVNTTQEPGLSDLSGMFPLAVGHNWSEDITTLTLIDLTMNS